MNSLSCNEYVLQKYSVTVVITKIAFSEKRKSKGKGKIFSTKNGARFVASPFTCRWTKT